MECRARQIFTVVQIVAAGVLVWFLIAWRTPWNAQRYIGTLLAVVGGSFIALARYQLGRSFSIKPEAHELVTSGLYSKIRNPIYVFGAVMITGLALVLQRPALWILVVVIVIAQTIRARREARVLEAAFGDAYREYRRKTWF
jgi:protein-S-isoprenylcysteine O-methyltransferase Ste14